LKIWANPIRGGQRGKQASPFMVIRKSLPAGYFLSVILTRVNRNILASIPISISN
jgi:hypothetical protein